MRRQTISLCMIVKDEERDLPRCLKSVQGAIDEIIVVDTGSADATIAIARSFGAKVIRKKWTGDFAYARNIGVERAKGEWILFLDADEELELPGPNALRDWVRQDEIDGFFVQIHNYIGGGPPNCHPSQTASSHELRSHGATINPVLRLFRNQPYHRFEGRIHEQIATCICRHKPQAAFHITDIRVHHYGYRQETVIRKDKIRRNTELLREAIAAEPDNAFYLYNLGVEHLRVGDAKQAADVFGQARTRVDPGTNSYAHLLYKYEIRCRHMLGEWETARALTQEGLRLFPAYPDLLQLQAVCEVALGLRGQAKLTLLDALRVGAAPPGYHTEEGMGTYQSAYLLGQLEEEDSGGMGAIPWYVETLAMKPSLLPPLYRLFQVMRIAGIEAGIMPLIASRFSLKTGEAVWKIIGVLLECRCYLAVEALLTSPLGGKLSSGWRTLAALMTLVRSGRWQSAKDGLERAEQDGIWQEEDSDPNPDPDFVSNPDAPASEPGQMQGRENRIRALQLQFDWLNGLPAAGDPAVDLLHAAAGTPASSLSAAGSMERESADPAGPIFGNGILGTMWGDLQGMLEGSARAERTGRFQTILAGWGQSLAERAEGDRVRGTMAFVRGLAAVADRHLAALDRSDFPMVNEHRQGYRQAGDTEPSSTDDCEGPVLLLSPVRLARLRLPGEMGF